MYKKRLNTESARITHLLGVRSSHVAVHLFSISLLPFIETTALHLHRFLSWATYSL